MRLKGKIAVITGAGSGIGQATAELFAREGAKVIGGDMNLAALEAVADKVRQAGGEMCAIKTNIAVREQAEALVDEALSRYSRLDILVNNAGVMDHNAGVAAVTDEMWERIFSVNVTGTMYMTRKGAQVMLANGGGAIINMASTAGVNGATAGVAYTASKHAVVGLTRSTAWQYAQRGVRCNAVMPGGTMTNIVQLADLEKWDQEGSSRITPYHQLMPMTMETIDLAELVLFLGSDAAVRINGAIIPADGGWTTS
jgi:NAD(P)-dependent dehydrogenase (short-subunit alcohol dehydrogenase family)